MCEIKCPHWPQEVRRKSFWAKGKKTAQIADGKGLWHLKAHTVWCLVQRENLLQFLQGFFFCRPFQLQQHLNPTLDRHNLTFCRFCDMKVAAEWAAAGCIWFTKGRSSKCRQILCPKYPTKWCSVNFMHEVSSYTNLESLQIMLNLNYCVLVCMIFKCILSISHVSSMSAVPLTCSLLPIGTAEVSFCVAKPTPLSFSMDTNERRMEWN